MESGTHLAEMYHAIVNQAEQKGELPEEMIDQLRYKKLETLDELELAYYDLIEALERKEFYTVLFRINKLETALEQESDVNRRAEYTEKIRTLAEKLDSLSKDLPMSA